MLGVLSATCGSIVAMGRQFLDEHERVVVGQFEPKVSSELAFNWPTQHYSISLHSFVLVFTTLWCVNTVTEDSQI